MLPLPRVQDRGGQVTRAALLLALLAGCATPRAQGWQDTPSEVRGQTITVVLCLFGRCVVVGVDQSGDVGGGSTGEQKADATADVRANPTLTPLR